MLNWYAFQEKKKFEGPSASRPLEHEQKMGMKRRQRSKKSWLSVFQRATARQRYDVLENLLCDARLALALKSPVAFSTTKSSR